MEEDGWYRMKAKGGHRQYKHPVKKGRVTISGQMNETPPPKTTKGIFAQAKLNPEDYE